MKKLLCFLSLLAAVRLLAVSPVPFTEGVDFSFKIDGSGAASITVYDETGSQYILAYSSGSTIESSTGTAWLRPGKVYNVQFWGLGPPDYWMSFVAPIGYTVYLDGVAADELSESPGSGWFLHNHTVEIRPQSTEAGGMWGSFSGIAIGKSATWSVGLGDLRTGRSAGAIEFKEVDLSYAPNSRDRLFYAAPPANVGQIVVIKDGASNQTLRQIVTPIGFTDIVDVTGGYEFRCYAWSQVSSWNGTLYSFSGSPWKTIKVESPASNQLKITETEGTVVRVSQLSRTVPTSATGGTITSGGGYIKHTFNSSGTFTVNSGISSVDYLVVAGGGGGGGGSSENGGGGGGAGGVLTGSMSVSNTSYTVTVGAGGSGGTAGAGANGSNSVFAGSVTAVGGGFGGAYSGAAGTGGSGGGSGRDAACCNGSNTSGQGYAGGIGGAWSGASAGGGGGAGGAGNNGALDGSARSSGTASDGGIGYASSISGTSTYYAGGGAGAWDITTTPSGGLGGGGNYPGSGNPGNNGVANTGGGGSGALYANGGNGGSGVVIIRYSGDLNIFTWTLQEGNATTWARTTTHDSTVPTSGQRDDTVIVRTGGATGTIVAKTKYHYVNQAWGEELNSIIADPDTGGAQLTTTYAYWTTSTDLGNYRRVKSVTAPTGNWTAYEYYNDYDTRGQLKYEYHPFLDTPSTVPSTLSTTAGRVVHFTYTSDWTGRNTRPTLREETVTVGSTTTTVAKTTWSHGDNTGSGEPRAYTTINSYRDASGYQSSYSEAYRADADPDFAGQPYMAQAANLAQASTSISRGTFNTTTKAFAVSSSGDHWRQVTLHGSTSSTNATGGPSPTSVTSFDSQSCPAVYMIPGQSTADVVVRIAQGYVYRTETWVYTSSGFSLMTAEDFDYDGYGQLTQRWVSTGNGALTSYSYTNGRLISTTDPTGMEIQNTSFDEVGRLLTSVKKAATASGYTLPGDITTTYTYDGANNIRQTVVSGGSLSQTSTNDYDLSGRPTQAVVPGGYTTNYDYSLGPRTVRVYLPPNTSTGATKITETYYDGQAKSITGTAQVAQYISYTVSSTTGMITRQTIFGNSTSSNLVKDTADWLGRPFTQVQPGWSGTDTTKSWTYDNTTGQLIKLSQPGLADTLYSYDTMGNLFRECLDVDSSGTIGLSSASDRITEHGWAFFQPSGSSNWWSSKTTKTYATASSSTATQVGKVEVQLNGLATNRLSLTNTTDIYGNVTSQYVDVSRSSKLVTTTTDVPDSSTDAVQFSYNGLVVSSKTTANQTTTTGYDALGRPTTSVDPRIGTTTTAYISGTNQVDKVTDPASNVPVTYTYDSVGRVATKTNALSKVCRYSYTSRGEPYRIWGDTDNPVEYSYDDWGHQITMKTYRGGTGWNQSDWPGTGSNTSNSPGTADTTTWAFHEPTGLLSSKTDAASKAVSYTYTQARQIHTRDWARIYSGTDHVKTTYTYSSTTGELTDVTYNDGTPALNYTYNRLGKMNSVKDATDTSGAQRFTYNLGGSLEMQHEDLPSYFGSRRITYPVASSGVIGRPTGLQLGTSGSPSSEQSITYGYESITSGYGRFNSLAAASRTLSYTYDGSSNLIASIEDTTSGTGTGWKQVRTYVSNRDLLKTIETQYTSSTSNAKFDYDPANDGSGHDALGRRTTVKKTGAMFDGYDSFTTHGLKTNWGYNDRSELTSETTTDLNSTPLVINGRQDTYSYDNMSNRSTMSKTRPTGDAGGNISFNYSPSGYEVDALNRYIRRTVPGVFDISMFSTATSVTVTATSSGTGTMAKQGQFFFRGHALNNSSGPVYDTYTVTPFGGSASPSQPAFLPGANEDFGYDDDGNLTSDGRWLYTYDAENRLIAMETKSAAYTAGLPRQKLQFTYDYLGRRVDKLVSNWDTFTSMWIPASEERFVYDGWNAIAKLNYLSSNALVASYYWGIDWSGTMQGAGGVGGLLMTQESSNTYLPMFDGNGNVMGMVTTASVTLGGTSYSAGSVVAAYEYDAFGQTLRESGNYAASNPWRFSTKYGDIESGLIYYGHRYYSPWLGRWICRDPKEEDGGRNLYAFLHNNAINSYDYLGWDSAETEAAMNHFEGYDIDVLHLPSHANYAEYVDTRSSGSGTDVVSLLGAVARFFGGGSSGSSGGGGNYTTSVTLGPIQYGEPGAVDDRGMNTVNWGSARDTSSAPAPSPGFWSNISPEAQAAAIHQAAVTQQQWAERSHTAEIIYDSMGQYSNALRTGQTLGNAAPYAAAAIVAAPAVVSGLSAANAAINSFVNLGVNSSINAGVGYQLTGSGLSVGGVMTFEQAAAATGGAATTVAGRVLTYEVITAGVEFSAGAAAYRTGLPPSSWYDWAGEFFAEKVEDHIQEQHTASHNDNNPSAPHGP